MTTPLGYTRTSQLRAGAARRQRLRTADRGDGRFVHAARRHDDHADADVLVRRARATCAATARVTGTSVLCVRRARPDDERGRSRRLVGQRAARCAARAPVKPAGTRRRPTHTFRTARKPRMQTPSERAFGVATPFTYDLDGNVSHRDATHHGCVPHQTCNRAEPPRSGTTARTGWWRCSSRGLRARALGRARCPTTVRAG